MANSSADQNGMPSESKDVSVSIDAKYVSQLEEGFDTEESARDYVALKLKKVDGYCATQWQGKMYFLVSRHADRRISVTVEKTWTYDNTQYRETRVYSVAPAKEYRLECNIPGPTRQYFKQEIIAAYFE